MAKRTNQVMRNLQSAGRTAAKFTGRTTEKAAVGLARWLTTGHAGLLIPPDTLESGLYLSIPEFIYDERLR